MIGATRRPLLSQQGFTHGVTLDADGQHLASEIPRLAVRRGMTIETVDVQVYYPPPEERHSHYHPWLDTLRIIRVVVPFATGLRR